MIFKSRQVNLDPLPYVDQHGSTRSPDGDPAGHDFDVHFEYDPRPEFEPTRDPKPWAHRAYGDRSEFSLNSFVWAPRREEFDTPVNHVLVQVRLQTERTGDFLTVAKNILSALDRGERSLQVLFLKWTPDEIEHARRVLTRLIRFIAREEA